MRAVQSGAILIGLLAACGSDTALDLDVDPNEIPADGRDTIALSATVQVRGAPAKDGTDVTFKVEARSAGANPGTFQRFADKRELKVDTLSGRATADFFPPPLAGEITISASFKDPNGATVSASRKLTVGPPTPVASTRFSFHCDHEMVGALVPGVGEIRIPCYVGTDDRRGRKLPYAPLTMKAEAGYFVEEPIDDDNWDAALRRMDYVIPANAARPFDTSPHSGEQVFGSPPLASANPRDGLVTLVAATYGEEGFNDGNNDGVHNPGEGFDDLGEPFLDIDDDGLYDEEMYHPGLDWIGDNNDNGQRDGPNGRWDTGVIIGRVTRILWTGLPVKAGFSAFSPFCACTSTSLTYSAMDDNYNPPAAFRPTSDKLDLGLPAATKFQVTPSADVPLTNQHQLLFAGSPNFKEDVLHAFTGLAQDGDLPRGRQWRFTISDGRTSECADCGTDAGAGRCDVINDDLTVSIKHSPAPGAAQLSSPTATVFLSTVDWFNAPCPGH